MNAPISFSSLDGLTLHGTLTAPSTVSRLAVLVHGGGVTRDEGGFYTRLAHELSRAEVASLRFDFRGHGTSGGTQEELTLAGVANDIRAALHHLHHRFGALPTGLIGASFSGGITALTAATHPHLVQRLVLLNPLLDYKKRFIHDKPYWHADHLDDAHAHQLTANKAIPHSPTFGLGRALLNEVFYFDPTSILQRVQAPTLFVHGTKDTFIPVHSSREAVTIPPGATELLEIDGAQHGFAVHDDPTYAHPQTQQWQTQVITHIRHWITTTD